jgi:hypothetical protein
MGKKKVNLFMDWLQVCWVFLLVFTVVIMSFGIAHYYRTHDNSSVSAGQKVEGGVRRVSLSRGNSGSSKAASILTDNIYDCCMNDLTPGLQNSKFTLKNVNKTGFSQLTVAQDIDSPLYTSKTVLVEGSEDELTWSYIGEFVLETQKRVSVIKLNQEYHHTFVRVQSSDRDDEQIRYWKICQFSLG